MRRRWLLLLVLVFLAVGVLVRHFRQPAAGDDVPLYLEQLRVELPRSDDHGLLTAALDELPEALRTALEETGVLADTVSVTVSTSSAASCEALTGGGIDVAFLPADDYAVYGEGLTAILGDGISGSLCTADSVYGRELASRAQDSMGPTWEDLDRAVWGLTESRAGRAAADLWLADHQDGSTTRELTQVMVYESQEALERAAAAGAVDVYMTAAPSDGVTVLGTSEILFDWVAAVSGESDPAFAAALGEAVARLTEAHPDWDTLFGTAHYTPVADDALDANRRLATLG